jgi:chitodextrinase
MRFRRTCVSGTVLVLAAAGLTAGVLPAAPASAAIAEPDTTPPSVSAPVPVANTPTTLTASWGPGTDNVGITGYQIQLLPQGGAARTVDVAAGVTSFQFTGLTPGAGYGLALRASDAAGNWSTFIANPALIFLPTDGSPPTRPGPAVASNITSSGFTLTWAPSTDNFGVTQYTIFATVQDVVWLATSTQPTHTFTNLPANTEFSVTIGARDAAGNSSLRSTPVNVRTLGPNAGGCTATYRITSSWPGNVQGEVTVTNTGPTTLTGWTVRWTFPSGVTISQLWNGTVVSGAPSVVVRDAVWNGMLGPNQTATFGFLAQSSAPTIPPVTCSSP